MNFTSEQKHQLNRLMDYRDEITKSLFHIQRILKEYFPEEFDVAYQHWIPQISTALDEDKKWLPRGEQTMQHTLNRLSDKIQEDESKGVYKYIV
jgi:flagellar biosynthesis chaperone FliJ